MAKTRKGSRRVNNSTMSIPGLRQAMNHIKDFSMRLAKSGSNVLSSMHVEKLRKEWHRTFNKPLSVKLAKEYLSHLFKSRKNMTRKGSRKGKKGGALGYAPIAYRMEPGGLSPHGSYPDYVSKGFFVPQSDNIANCGKPWITDSVVPPGLGDNTVGGGKRTRRRINRKGGGMFSNLSTGLSAIGFKSWVSENPPTTYQTVMSEMNGAKPFPGGQAHETTYKYQINPNNIPPTSVPGRPYITPSVFTSPN